MTVWVTLEKQNVVIIIITHQRLNKCFRTSVCSWTTDGCQDNWLLHRGNSSSNGLQFPSSWWKTESCSRPPRPDRRKEVPNSGKNTSTHTRAHAHTLWRHKVLSYVAERPSGQRSCLISVNLQTPATIMYYIKIHLRCFSSWGFNTAVFVFQQKTQFHIILRPLFYVCILYVCKY